MAVPRYLYAVVALALSGPAASQAASLQVAKDLYAHQDFAGAEAELQQVVRENPNEAEGFYYLGLITSRPGTADAFEAALKPLKRATELAPENSKYIAEYGGISFLLAGKTRSVGAATRGRDAMGKAISLDPNNLNAREGLMQFYFQAPWPLGSTAKGMGQLEEIKKRDFNRGTTLLVQERVREKKFPEAFAACDEVLARDPQNSTALYQFGRVAALSGLQLEKGLAALQKCLSGPLPLKNQPLLGSAWSYTGSIQEKLGHKSEAVEAFQEALKFDPHRKDAIEGLARVKA